jgi:hypothetical protein
MIVGMISVFVRGDDAVGSPHRAHNSSIVFFELILLLKLDRNFPVKQFEATVSQSTVSQSKAHSTILMWGTNLCGVCHTRQANVRHPMGLTHGLVQNTWYQFRYLIAVCHTWQMSRLVPHQTMATAELRNAERQCQMQ